ncbi:MAG: DUF4335 domain-containing protein [Cyanobacteria bacterium P01_F01_bin.150]
MPVAVFRRYTPSTCTLELRGERSPLSAWSDRPIVKQVQFVLSIDGPQRPQERRVTLKGGRTQLDHLRAVIDTYVQHTLGLSAQQFQTTLLQTSPQQTSSSPLSPSATASPLPSAVSATSTGRSLATPGRIHDMGWARSPSPDIRVTSKGRLKHELQLGKLAPHPSISSVILSTTELFDLAHALDAYHSEVDSIPELNPGQRNGVQPWMKGAAVAVFAVGVTASVVSVLNQATLETAMQDSAVVENAIEPDFEQQLSQSLEPGASSSIALEDLPSTDEALPLGSEASDALSAESDGLDADSTPSTSSEEASINRQDSAESATLSAPLSQQANDSSSPTASPVESSPLPAEIVAEEARSNSTFSSPSISSSPATSSPATSSPTLPSANAGQLQTSARISDDGNVGASAELPPELTAIPPIPTVESALDPLADIGPSSRRSSTEAATGGDFQPSAQSAPAGIRGDGKEPSEPQAHSNSSEIQRTEVQSYFESIWQPPDDLSQALQYRLEFNADGSFQQAIPLGESARSYRSNVNFPATGNAFVSPFGGNDTPPMRLFLGANGQVRVFIESLD